MTTLEQAAAVIDAILTDYETHSRAAREIACDVLDARIVLSKFLDDPLLVGKAEVNDDLPRQSDVVDGGSR